MSSFSGGFGMISSLVTAERALADRGADAVRAGVAAADHHHVLAAGEDRRHVAERLVGDAAVLLRQEVHGEMDAVELAARDRQVARASRRRRQHDRVVAFGDALDRHADADMGVVVEDDALGFHLRDAPVDVTLLHLEVGDAVGEQAAGAWRASRRQVHVVAGARELLRAGQAGRARADHGDLLAGLRGRRLGRDPAFLPAAVDDRAFDRLDGDRRLDQVERAGRLARRRADAAGELGKLLVECRLMSASRQSPR